MAKGLDELTCKVLQGIYDEHIERVSWFDLQFRLNSQALSQELQKKWKANPLEVMKYGLGAIYCGVMRNKNNVDAVLEPIRSLYRPY